MLISIVNSFLLLHAVAFGLPSNLYLGVGYNILKANPDGGDWSSLGQDPGLLVTRNILDTAAGGQHYIKSTNYPQCSSALSTWVFYDPKTYQEYLRHYVTIDELTVSNVSLYAFSESQLYQDIKRKTFFQHDVFRDEISACPSLHARYTVPVVPIHKNLVTPEFARDACRLPALYNLQAYKHFLDNWGTHVTTEVEMGQKSATRYRLSVANLAEILLNSHDSNVASMLVEDFQGYGSVVHLNMSHIQHSDFSRLPLGTKISHFTIGAVTEAILSWTIIPISQVFSNDYWQNLDEFYRNGICDGDTMNLFQLKENFVKALNDYPIASGGEKPPSADIRLPITWPSGTYGLYMPKTGCPKDPGGFSIGYFTDDTENFKNQNNWTTGIHLNGTFNHGVITTYFCMKLRATSNEYNRKWPAGNYCILKKGDCPTG